MIREVKNIIECRCLNCGIIHLLGEKFNGQRCCERPNPMRIGYRKVPFYTKTNEEEKEEANYQMQSWGV